MSKYEIKGLFFFRKNYWLPYGLNIKDALWWRFMPGEMITVKWPVGQVKVGPSHRYGWSGYGPEFEYVDSADPNDHYRPWLEKNVGQQGWDWNWGLRDDNAADNRLTIKVRRKHAKWATYAALMWS
jgi:hypothetical protein